MFVFNLRKQSLFTSILCSFNELFIPHLRQVVVLPPVYEAFQHFNLLLVRTQYKQIITCLFPIQAKSRTYRTFHLELPQSCLSTSWPAFLRRPTTTFSSRRPPCTLPTATRAAWKTWPRFSDRPDFTRW